MQVLGDSQVRGWLAGEDEVAACVLDGGGDRLAGEQVVAEVDRPQMRQRRRMPTQPAFGGIALAVLLLRPVLRGDELRRQRQDLLVTRCDHAGAEKAVEILRPAVGAAPRRALAAVDFARAEILAAIQRDEHPFAQALEACQRPGLLDGSHEQPVERRRGGTVQHQADVVVRGDRRDAEQGLAVRPALAALPCPLVLQEGGATHEEQRERRQADVGHAVVAGAARSLALVGKTGADRVQLGDEGLDHTHTDVESTSEPQYKKNLPNAVADCHETHNMWQIGLSSPTIRGFSPGQIRTRLNRIENRCIEALPLVSAERYDVSLYRRLFRDHDASPGYRRYGFRDRSQNQRRRALGPVIN